MADLQDTNAATEEIYGPLLIVDCPVTDEMISQSGGQTVATARQSSFSCCSISFINQKIWVEATSRTDKNMLAVNMTTTVEHKCEKESETVKANLGRRKRRVLPYIQQPEGMIY